MKRVLVLAAAAAVIPAASVESARPPQLLTYSLSTSSRGRDGLCLARPNGRNAVHVTRRRDDRAAAWSREGRYVAFARQFPGNRALDIVVADSRGRVIRTLRGQNGGLETSPTWSPDGRRLAFAGGRLSSAVFLADRAGKSVRRLLVDAAQPAWSPDGKRLAFASISRADPGTPSVVTIGLNRRGRRTVARNASDPTWSPDGRRLAFVRHLGPGATEIAVANADGSGPRALTTSTEQELAPAWSPDGRYVAFERGQGSDERHWIVVVDAQSGAERWMIRHGFGLHDPSWRPPVRLPRARRASCR